MTLARIAALGLAASFLVALPGCRFSIGPLEQQKPGTIELKRGDAAEEKAALAVAHGILGDIDSGHAERTWQRTGDYIHQISNETSWVGMLQATHAATGSLKSRELESLGFTPNLEPGVPAGHYFGAIFHSEFERASATEKVVLSFEKGEWKMVGYFLQNMKFVGSRQ